MSGSGKAGNGRGNNRRRPFKRRENDSWSGGDSGWPGERGDSFVTASGGSGASFGSNERGGSAHRGSERKNNNRHRESAASGHRWSNENGREKMAGRKRPDETSGPRNSGTRKNSENPRGEKASFFERPKWIPPKMNTDPLPDPDCPYCGKPIRDISSAIADRDSGIPVHFDCVTARIAGTESLDKGETVSYLGGGRFGIVCAAASQGRSESRDFKIKKIIEWENKDKRAEWRSLICDHYSVT